ncbi:hypothetical protein E2320_006998, partial [Naja naja]
RVSKQTGILGSSKIYIIIRIVQSPCQMEVDTWLAKTIASWQDPNRLVLLDPRGSLLITVAT